MLQRRIELCGDAPRAPMQPCKRRVRPPTGSPPAQGWSLPEQAQSEKSQGVRGTESPNSFDNTPKKPRTTCPFFRGKYKFHLMVLAGQALDEVRRELARKGANLKGALWSLRGNVWNLTEERQEQRKNLCRQYTKLGRAMSLRESLQAIYASPERQVAEAELDWWCGWAARSRLGPFRKLAKTVRQHWDGILAYFDTHLTSAAIEAVNGIIQLAKRMARGFKNFLYFRTAAYHRAGKLNLAVPNIT